MTLIIRRNFSEVSAHTLNFHFALYMVGRGHALLSLSKRYRTILFRLLPPSFNPLCLSYLVKKSSPMKGMETCCLCLLV